MSTYDTVSFPEQLKMVKHLATYDTEIFLHQFQHFQRVLYFACYSPHHSSNKCGGRKGSFREELHLEFTGVLIARPHVRGFTFNHLNVAGRLQHVSKVANILEAKTANLKADGDKVSLLPKLSQAPS